MLGELAPLWVDSQSGQLHGERERERHKPDCGTFTATFDSKSFDEKDVFYSDYRDEEPSTAAVLVSITSSSKSSESDIFLEANRVSIRKSAAFKNRDYSMKRREFKNKQCRQD